MPDNFYLERLSSGFLPRENYLYKYSFDTLLSDGDVGGNRTISFLPASFVAIGDLAFPTFTSLEMGIMVLNKEKA